MAESLYTENGFAQYRGPSDSSAYNERIENLYKDLVFLLNKTNITQEEVSLFYSRMIKESLSLAHMINELDSRITILEEDMLDSVLFFNNSVVDVDRFTGTDFEISTVDTCTVHTKYGILTLPTVDASSISKIRTTDSDGNYAIPSSFEAVAIHVAGTADTSSNTIVSSDIFNAVYPEVGKVWERNVIASATDSDGAETMVYIKIPTEAAINLKSNTIYIDPFPMMGVDILDVSYTTNLTPLLNDNDGYTTLNSDGLHVDQDAAVGWIPPGSWSGDELINAGPKAFFFPEKEITALRIHLKQRNYFQENGKYIYSYGLSNLDIRYTKFLETGKTIVKFEPANGDTFSSIDNVTPDIWNLGGSEHPYLFTYRVIWETSYNSGSYTLEPVPLSQRAWIEITLNNSVDLVSPAVTALNIEYS